MGGLGSLPHDHQPDLGRQTTGTPSKVDYPSQACEMDSRLSKILTRVLTNR